ncbi:hypothetical protein V1639_10315 [Pseudarthrobacter sp. J75]|uniref:hypothetical protein n=1 Tax=unclassified Pseudarthrobacter TaxID=2647000 RepID=UPI002E81ED76|nr:MULTISPECIES: hypothetical protein [unclassified Pseudarthrobacter]MEE2522986.1 hypothetical protein [Pseudarthrobacter sp. J47]MEE2529421.1 hypothetical protein [Pseudarthrobacter sp. J75]
MTRIALSLDRAEAEKLEGYDEVFLWDGSATDSFKSKLRPSLPTFGSVGGVNADFVRIALAVYASDHTVLRESKGSEWNQRSFELTVPVSVPAKWAAQADSLRSLLGYLTGDTWSMAFVQSGLPDALPVMVKDTSLRTVLFSGGADSATGALVSAHSLGPHETHNLLSHSSSGATGAAQQLVTTRLNGHFGSKNSAHHRIFLARAKKRLDGTKFPKEPSSRSRSLLFLALGLAAAEQGGGPLWIPENGFASLNPPLGPERRGALSTRTTQPWFLWRVSSLLTAMEGHGSIINPFQHMTKGEMFRRVESILGADGASDYLSTTSSCSHTDQQYVGVPSGTHCGVCFGCIVRRASFKASGVVDQTWYLSNESSEKILDYVEKKSVMTAMRDFVELGVDEAVIMAMPLPPGYLARMALELSQKGMSELQDFLA